MAVLGTAAIYVCSYGNIDLTSNTHTGIKKIAARGGGVYKKA